MPTYYFFDSSALVKRYHAEVGTAEVERIFNEAEAVLLISRLTLVEVQSAFARKVREGELGPEAFALACQRLSGDVVQKQVQVLRMTEGHYQTAERLVQKYGPDKSFRRLRSLDALQLSVALEQRERGRLTRFVAADGNLCKLAEVENLTVINPEQLPTV